MLTGFQIRASRHHLRMYIKDIANAIGIHESTLKRLENCTGNLSFIKCNSRTMLLIKKFYEQKNIIFSENNSIGILSNSLFYHDDSLNKFQFYTSRIATRLSIKDLGKMINTPESTLWGWELQKDCLKPIKCNTSRNKEKLKKAKKLFNNLGIIYPACNIVEILEDPEEKV